MPRRLAFVIGYGGAAIPVLREVLVDESRKHGFEYLVLSTEKEPGKEGLGFVRSSDVVFVYAHNVPHDLVHAIRESRGTVIAVTEACSELNNAPLWAANKAYQYFRLGGPDNLRGLIRFMLSLAGAEVEVPDPVPVPWHGIYHPRLGTFTELKEYLERYELRDRPLVGVLFNRSDWLYGRTLLVDKLVEKLEQQGLGVIPVFTYGLRDEVAGIPGTEDAIREFFFLNGKPVIEVLVSLKWFFLLDHSSTKPDGYREAVSGVELLRKLGVPVLGPIVSFSQARKDWVESEQGVDYMTQVYRVIMPEIDGVAEPVMASCMKLSDEGVKEYDLIEEHLNYIARRVKRWVELRGKPPRERRVAIILINPPCKGLEANVAVGLGLDVPESVVKLLWRLKEEGYYLGEDPLPRSGEELIKMIMERKAISEFRWTPVEEIVARGGALDFVGEDQYMEWFMELPEPARKRMIEEWGDPRDVLRGTAPRELVGMVYHGKFVVPGLRFGNVVVLPQPKRGCAGPRCDGKVCRILHDPTIPPPHQWLAVYRWVTRVFRADVVIHFGTHGYLEFLPGKGVGLSPWCWPEISIDDVPHLYVYVVSNPMEGVIAKRRSYAVIVDHLYPAMARAEVLEDLDNLVNQYLRAKGLGEGARAKKIYEEILQKARELNVEVKAKEPDEVVEEVHRYLDLIRSSQVNMGLHVLGEPPSGKKLAEYVVTALSYDSPEAPGLLRSLASELGIDYDDVLRNPTKINPVLGVPNREVKDLLFKACLRIVSKLLEKPWMDDYELSKLIREEVEQLCSRRSRS